MTSALTARETRVLNPRPRRHHRRTYSLVEFRLGVGVLGVVGLIGAWVAWRGAHPDPALFANPAALLDPGKPDVDRGALPTLSADPWRERGLARFEAANLYEKIDGRADYFLARGFRSLTFVTLEDPQAGAAAVDVEFYDLGAPDNAMSAFAGEKPPEQRAESRSGSTWYLARNALFVARGAYYVRAIGSDESPGVRAQLERLRGVLETRLAAGEKPWAEALFVDRLGVAPGRVSFLKENAFSFGFARDVYVAQLDDESEMFVAAAPDPAAARALAARFGKGFLEYGERVDAGGAAWVKDRYLGSFARAVAADSLVVGVRGAPSLEAGSKSVERLRAAATAMPPPSASPTVAASAAAGAGPGGRADER